MQQRPQLTREELAIGVIALGKHSARQEEVVALRALGLKQEAIAATLGITQGEVSRILKRAANNLNKARNKLIARRPGKRYNS